MQPDFGTLHTRAGLRAEICNTALLKSSQEPNLVLWFSQIPELAAGNLLERVI